MKLNLDKEFKLTVKDIFFVIFLSMGLGCGIGLFLNLAAEILFSLTVAYLCFLAISHIITDENI
jgi:hypothetical protein